jgi:hypothetical protein
MKRYGILILCVLALAAFAAGCQEQAPTAENITFTAVIEAVNEYSLLVSTTEDVGFDKASVSYADEMPEPDFGFNVGQTVRITILPLIAESYPVQVRAVSIELVSEPETSADPEAEQPAFEASYYRADAMAEGGFEFLLNRMLNADKMAISAVRHIPVMLFESAEDLAAFIEEGKAHFQFDHSYGETDAFSSIADVYDDAFFGEKALLVLYASETSGSIRHAVEEVRVEGDGLSVLVCAIVPEIGTDDMADWFIVVALEKDVLTGVSAFDAWYQ